MGATRSFWKGSLKLSLVSVPVRMLNASQPKSRTTVSFHKLHDKKPDGKTICHSRIRHKNWCPVCNVEVTDTIRGYEHAKGQFVIVDDDDLETCEANTEGGRTLEITTVTTDRVDPVFIDSMAYLVPDGPEAAQTFETLRIALGRKRIAIGTVVLSDTNTLVALEPAPNAFIVYRLRSRTEVRLLEDIETLPAVTTNMKDVKLATQLLDNLEGQLEYVETEDSYTANVRVMLEQKISGKKYAKKAQAPPAPAQAPSLEDLLEASLKAKLPTKAAATAKAGLKDEKKRKRA